MTENREPRVLSELIRVDTAADGSKKATVRFNDDDFATQLPLEELRQIQIGNGEIRARPTDSVNCTQNMHIYSQGELNCSINSTLSLLQPRHFVDDHVMFENGMLTNNVLYRPHVEVHVKCEEMTKMLNQSFARDCQIMPAQGLEAPSNPSSSQNVSGGNNVAIRPIIRRIVRTEINNQMKNKQTPKKEVPAENSRRSRSVPRLSTDGHKPSTAQKKPTPYKKKPEYKSKSPKAPPKNQTAPKPLKTVQSKPSVKRDEEWTFTHDEFLELLIGGITKKMDNFHKLIDQGGPTVPRQQEIVARLKKIRVFLREILQESINAPPDLGFIDAIMKSETLSETVKREMSKSARFSQMERSHIEKSLLKLRRSYVNAAMEKMTLFDEISAKQHEKTFFAEIDHELMILFSAVKEKRFSYILGYQEEEEEEKESKKTVKKIKKKVKTINKEEKCTHVSCAYQDYCFYRPSEVNRSIFASPEPISTISDL